MALVAVPLPSPSLHRFNHPKFSGNPRISSETLINRRPWVIRPQLFNSYSSRDTIGQRVRACAVNGSERDPDRKESRDEEVKDLGVRAALSMLKFYKREISPLLPSSCRYVPTCSGEYSMEAYKKYGVAKGTILTAWRLCRCNPLGGSGFDPPRWFGDENQYEDS
ncbi:hypothetical protein J5N97_030278 [Dioscorea zingiberensis]|uniref:Uncharacterized protein n=1 Tax=Dioscorea zingiberensis TaxID=325984 RepID=A0A9D5BXD7_9LILI|nr:hypothetical protein J5N97_030278 [Dioscorea zingiberensis]